MPPKARLALRPVVLALVIALAAATVSADGPVAQVVGVSLVSDTDGGSGERWGRAGGRTLTYAVGDTSGYAALSWGNVAGTAPSLAFDNVLNPSEILAFDPTSNLAGGVARWQGSAGLVVNGIFTTVGTRFVLTTTSGGNPVPLASIPGGAAPGVNLIGLTDFSANLRFEMLWAGQWQPVLDIYDVLPTVPGGPPGGGGPVLTSFDRGFYFTTATSSLTLDEHDANITARLTALGAQVSSVKDDTAFLRIDTVGRLQGVQASVSQVEAGVGQVQNGVSQVQGSVDQLTQIVQGLPLSQIPPDIARQSDVSAAKNDLMQTLLVLFGLAPCPQPAMCDAATLINELATQASVDDMRQQLSGLQTAIETLQESLSATNSALEMQVVELGERERSKRRRWLVRTSLNGQPASATLAALVAVSTDKRDPAAPADVTALATVAEVMPGLLEVTLEVRKPSLTDLAFHFTVHHSTGTESLQASWVVGDIDQK